MGVWCFCSLWMMLQFSIAISWARLTFSNCNQRSHIERKRVPQVWKFHRQISSHDRIKDKCIIISLFCWFYIISLTDSLLCYRFQLYFKGQNLHNREYWHLPPSALTPFSRLFFLLHQCPFWQKEKHMWSDLKLFIWKTHMRWTMYQ